jgi:site-specific recombinase XerD
LVEQYLKICETRGLAEATLEHRSSELGRFGHWLKKRRPKPRLDQVDADLVVRFIGSRSAFRARATVCGVVTELRGMGDFLVQEGVWAKNPLRWIRGPKIDQRSCLPKRINRGHLKALWAAAQRRPQEHTRYQAVFVLAVLYGTGIRCGELHRLDIADWDPVSATLRVDGRKTGRARSIAVGEGVWRCIEAYLPRRQNQLEKAGRVGEQALLVNHKGARMDARDIANLIRRLAVCAEVPHVTAHQFRHSCASDLLEAGVTLPEVQRILGHASIQSTVRYVDIADPCRAAAMEKHPVNRFLGAGTREETP